MLITLIVFVKARQPDTLALDSFISKRNKRRKFDTKETNKLHTHRYKNYPKKHPQTKTNSNSISISNLESNAFLRVPFLSYYS